jgi:phage baseplate assembly protein W
MEDVYARTENDPSYVVKLEETDEIEMLTQQINMLIFTERGEVLGTPEYGTGILDYLFNAMQSMTLSRIENEIESQINFYLPLASKYPVNITVNAIDPARLTNAVYINVQIQEHNKFGVVVKK